jgi:hypothetical protein
MYDSKNDNPKYIKLRKHIKGLLFSNNKQKIKIKNTYIMPPNAPETQAELQHSYLTIAVVGLGMTAVTFMEKIIEYDTDKHYRIIVFGDEPQCKKLMKLQF